MSKNTIIISTIFIISLLTNLLFFVDALNYPTYQLGVLRKNITVSIVNNDSTARSIINFPKGMVVFDTSPRFIAAEGMINPDRISFNIAVDKDWVDYSKSSTISFSKSNYPGSIEVE